MTSLERLLGAAALALAFTGCASGVTNDEPADTTADRKLPREADGQRAELLSAFFGLDNALPALANLICTGAPGKDGMPVIFSTEIDHTTMQAGDFQVTLSSGEVGSVHCVTLLPATDAGELRTVLLVGEFGDEGQDPPARVEIVGHLQSIDGKLDFQGTSSEVTPLEKGPTLVMAQIVSEKEEDMGLGLPRTKGSMCPTKGITQKVRVVWAGGVTLEDDSEPGDRERELYTVTVQTALGQRREVTPVALADLGDGDNNHVLCLNTQDKPVSVAFPSGILTDPNDDLNPATSVLVQDLQVYTIGLPFAPRLDQMQISPTVPRSENLLPLRESAKAESQGSARPLSVSDSRSARCQTSSFGGTCHSTHHLGRTAKSQF